MNVGVDLDSIMMYKTNICISFFNCNNNYLRTPRSFFSVLNSLELVILPVLFNNRNVSPDLDIKGVIGASIHPMLYRPMYPQPVSKFIKLHFFNPNSESDLHFLNLFGTYFIV